MSRSSEIEERVVYGLDSVDPDRKIEVSLKDLLFTYQTIGELIAFFHDSDKYPTLESVHQVVGDRDKGALNLLWEIYYRKLYDVWPEDIIQGFDESRFDKPVFSRDAD
jgi:hypothetical protein